MQAITFDTLEYSKTLQKSGFSQEQAEAMAKAQRNAMQEMIAAQQLVTKSDIQEMKHELLKWIMGIALAQTVLLIAVFAFIK